MLIRTFYFCYTFVKYKLFASYCNNIYLCYLWVNVCIKIDNIAYNNAFRILLGLSRCSASGMFANSGVPSYGAMHRILVSRLY